MNKNMWLIKTLNVVNKPKKISYNSFLKASKGIGIAEGFSNEQINVYIEDFFNHYNDIVYVDSKKSKEVQDIVINWVKVGYSKDLIWVLRNATTERSHGRWDALASQLDSETKKRIVQDISAEIVILDEQNAVKTDLLINKSRMHISRGMSVPTSNWDNKYPVKFYYDYAIRDCSIIYDGLNDTIAKLLDLIIYLDKKAATVLLEKVNHPMIQLYLSHYIVEINFYRETYVDWELVKKRPFPLMVTSALVQTLLSVQKLRIEVKNRKKKNVYQCSKELEKYSDQELLEKASLMEKNMQEILASINPQISIRIYAEVLANCEFIYHGKMGQRSEESIALEKMVVNEISTLRQNEPSCITPEEILIHLKTGTRKSKARFLWDIGKNLHEIEGVAESFATCMLKDYSNRLLDLKAHDFYSSFEDRDFVAYVNSMGEMLEYLNSKKLIILEEFFAQIVEQLPITVWDKEEDHYVFINIVRHFFHLTLVLTVTSATGDTAKDNLIANVKEQFLGLWEFCGNDHHLDEMYPDLIIKNIFLVLHQTQPDEANKFLKEVLNYRFFPKITLRELISKKLVLDSFADELIRMLEVNCEQALLTKNKNSYFWWHATWTEIGNEKYALKVSRAIYYLENFSRSENADLYIGSLLKYLQIAPQHIQDYMEEVREVFRKAYPVYATDKATLERKRDVQEQFGQIGIAV